MSLLKNGGGVSILNGGIAGVALLRWGVELLSGRVWNCSAVGAELHSCGCEIAQNWVVELLSSGSQKVGSGIASSGCGIAQRGGVRNCSVVGVELPEVGVELLSGGGCGIAQ